MALPAAGELDLVLALDDPEELEELDDPEELEELDDPEELEELDDPEELGFLLEE